MRQPAVAGSFYPADPDQLRKLVRGFLDAAGPGAAPCAPKAIIAPHAGYIFSGPVAGFAHARLGAGRDRITRVVLAGPAHRVRFSGVALAAAEAFLTPFGPVPVDPGAAAALRDLPGVRSDDRPHVHEHSLEVQLPFLQEVLGPFSLVPLAVGEADPALVDSVLERLWGGPETAIVVSSDLSHYLDLDQARRLDRATSAAIVGLHPEALGPEDACGRVPVCGLLAAARRHGLKGELLDLRTSADTAGPRDQVVGYGAYAFA
jgi:hypothetical protein